jgi:hypothetical protein
LDNGKEFVAKIVKELMGLWLECKIVKGHQDAHKIRGQWREQILILKKVFLKQVVGGLPDHMMGCGYSYCGG